MCKFLAIVARNNTPGTNGIDYRIHDTVTFDPKKDIEQQMRKYAWRYFYNVKHKNPRKFKEQIFCRRRHVQKTDGSIFAERIKIYEHDLSNELIGFIPKECFDW